LKRQGKEWVSSQQLARAFSLTDSTVRRDLSHVAFSGRAKRGYKVDGLEQILADALGVATRSKVVIVGAGNVGRALSLHEDFTARGFEVCGIFDSDPKLFGQRIGHLEVQSIDRLKEVVRDEGVEIGIIAVPASAARVVALELTVAGVRGLLNLASVHLSPPKGVAVVDVRLVESLQELSCAIRMQRHA
jgi:redox-sensing transcriptional repressor